MPLHVRLPGPPLSNSVQCLWLSEAYHLPHAQERILPDGSLQVVLNLAPEKLRFRAEERGVVRHVAPCVVAGSYSRPFVIDTAQQAFLVGVHFRPGGAAPFFPVPVGELHNEHVALEDLWRGDVERLREALVESRSVDERFRRLEEFLLRRAAVRPPPHFAVTFALRQLEPPAPMPRMAELAERIGYSQRRFIELFRNEVGMTPKLYGRLRRFQAAVRELDSRKIADWEQSYFDQAHFIHEFREFSGFSPGAYLARRSFEPNHVVLS